MQTLPQYADIKKAAPTLSTDDLAYVVAALVDELNARRRASSEALSAAIQQAKADGKPLSSVPVNIDEPSDWATFALLKSLSSYDDGVLPAFNAHCHDMGVDEDGYRLDSDGYPVGDGYYAQVESDYRMAQGGSFFA